MDFDTMPNKKNVKKKVVAEWYLLIDSEEEGPYSIADLRYHKRLTPDTLVWKKGLPKWMPARAIFELQCLFKDDSEESSFEENVKKRDSWDLKNKQETLVLHQDQFPFFWWIFLVFLLILYFSYLINK